MSSRYRPSLARSRGEQQRRCTPAMMNARFSASSIVVPFDGGSWGARIPVSVVSTPCYSVSANEPCGAGRGSRTPYARTRLVYSEVSNRCSSPAWAPAARIERASRGLEALVLPLHQAGMEHVGGVEPHYAGFAGPCRHRQASTCMSGRCEIRTRSTLEECDGLANRVARQCQTFHDGATTGSRTRNLCRTKAAFGLLNFRGIGSRART